MDLENIHPCVDVMDDGDEVFIDKDGLSNSSKYLIRKIQGRLRRLQRDLQIVIVEVNYWKLRVRQIIQESHEAAEKILMVGDEDTEKVLKQLKKVTRIMGSSDTEITFMKASLSNFHNLVSDEVEDDSIVVFLLTSLALTLKLRLSLKLQNLCLPRISSVISISVVL